MSARRGFTTPELLVTLAIVGLVAGMGGYTMFSSARTSPERADIYAVLTQARQAAFVRHQCSVVTVDKQTIDVTYYKPKSGGDCSAPFVQPALGSRPTYQVPAGASIGPLNTGLTNLVFNIDGGLTPDALVSFTVTPRSRGVVNFKVYPAIGQVRAQ